MATSLPIAEYDPAGRTYSVQFKPGGKVYVYKSVDGDTAAQIDGADSKGAAVGQLLVRGGYEFDKIDPPNEDA